MEHVARLFRPLMQSYAWNMAAGDHAERGRVARQTLEPIHCAISLCLLSVMPLGSKLSIRNHGVHVQTKTVLQGCERSRNGDSFEDLTMLRRPLISVGLMIRSATGDRKARLSTIAAGAAKGMRALVLTYEAASKYDARLLTKYRAVRDLITLYAKLLAGDDESGDSTPSPLDHLFRELWSDRELAEVCTLFELSGSATDMDRAAALLEPVRMLLDSKQTEIEGLITAYQRGGVE